MAAHRVFALLLALAGFDAGAAPPTISGCPVLPADNIWNARVDTLPVHARSAAWVNNGAFNAQNQPNGATRIFHMDFGAGLYEGAPIGIPFVIVNNAPKVPMFFDEEAEEESDPGPYPIPNNPPIEGGPDSDGDRHVLVIDVATCKLYESGNTYPRAGGGYDAYSGAIFDLNSNALRPATWTSADAAGLPIFPGLVRYDEVASGVITHALRFTLPRTQGAFIWPARHEASSIADLNTPPMGARFRLRADVNIASLSPHARVIAQAMKDYGIMLADNGSAWYVSGAPDDRWDNDVLHELDFLTGAHFDAVDTSSLMVSANSGQVNNACTPGDTDGDGLPNCVELAEGRNPAVKDNAIFTSARLFAMQQYRDFLGREGDAPGITLWTNQVTSNTMTRPQVIQAFFDSTEFQNGLPQITRLYFAFFNRIPDYPGLLFHTGRFRVGVPLNTIAQDFAGSQEFLLTYGSLTNGEYVDLVYQNVLGRPADPAGRANAIAQLDGSAMTRGELMAAFSESQEHRNLSAAKVFVTSVYVGMLRRSPDVPGLANWVNAFSTGTPRLQMLQEFMNSTEYHNRFLP